MEKRRGIIFYVPVNSAYLLEHFYVPVRERKVVFQKTRSDGSELLLTNVIKTKGQNRVLRGGVKLGSIAVCYSF